MGSKILHLITSSHTSKKKKENQTVKDNIEHGALAMNANRTGRKPGIQSKQRERLRAVPKGQIWWYGEEKRPKTRKKRKFKESKRQ